VRVFVTGATGAVGRPLVAQLVEAGHEVVGTTRSKERADDLRTRWVELVVVDALDGDALAAAVRRARPDAVVQQLTALLKAGAAAAGEREHAATSNLRVEGTRALLRGAPDARMVAQSVAFLTRPDGPGSVGVNARAVRDMVEDVRKAGGSLCATGSSMAPAPGTTARGPRPRRSPRAARRSSGTEGGLWPWLHVDDAASATVAALERREGEMNVCRSRLSLACRL
jgi:nucleoside-diphosphate-sugar epimerase